MINQTQAIASLCHALPFQAHADWLLLLISPCDSPKGICIHHRELFGIPFDASIGSSKLLWSGKLPITPPASICSATLSRCPDNECCDKNGFCTSDVDVCGQGLCTAEASGQGSFKCNPSFDNKVVWFTFDVSKNCHTYFSHHQDPLVQKRP